MVINKLFHNKVTLAKNRGIKYIVVHYTAGTTSKKGSAKNTANYFKTSTVQGSADYIVDDEEIYLCNSDIKNQYSWAVGGSKYNYMTTSVGGTYYNNCTNKNSISVEICSNKTNKSNLGSNDIDWYFTNSALNLAAELIRNLMTEYNISIENVLMHHHVTGKVCPNPFCINEAALSKWRAFKNSITNTKNTEVKKEEEEVIDTTLIRVNGKDIKIDRILKDGRNFIELRGLENVGFEVGYEPDSKLVTLKNKYNELPLNIDGNETSVEAVNIEGHNFCPIRSISKAVGNFDVDYKEGKVFITTQD